MKVIEQLSQQARASTKTEENKQNTKEEIQVQKEKNSKEDVQVQPLKAPEDKQNTIYNSNQPKANQEQPQEEVLTKEEQERKKIFKLFKTSQPQREKIVEQAGGIQKVDMKVIEQLSQQSQA